MEYTKIDGYDVSKYTLGTVQLGMEYGIANKAGKPDLTRSFDILKTAVNEGVNTFDTSLHYGESEKILGKFFFDKKNIASTVYKPVICTKFKVDVKERYFLDAELEAGIEKIMRECVEASMQNLKIDKIPIYMLHDPKAIYKYGRIIASVMKKLKNENIIGTAGVSVYNCEEACEMLKYDVFEAIQLPMNIFDSRFIKSGLLKQLHQKEIAVFVRSIFLQGLFFLNPNELKGNLKDAKKYLLMLNDLAEREGISVPALALSYIRDMDEVASIVIGAETPEQVKQNAALFNNTPKIKESIVNDISHMFDDIPEHILIPSMWNLQE